MADDYTNLRVQFVEYDTPLFQMWRAWDVPASASYVLLEADPRLPPDPEYPGYVISDTAILFTRGHWRYENPALPGGETTFGLGDGAFRHRLPNRYRIRAMDETNGKLCVRPKDGAIWGRSAICVPNMESLILGPWPTDRYLFVGKGRLVLDDGSDVDNTTPLCIPANTTMNVTSTNAAFALLMWPPNG